MCMGIVYQHLPSSRSAVLLTEEWWSDINNDVNSHSNGHHVGHAPIADSVLQSLLGRLPELSQQPYEV